MKIFSRLLAIVYSLCLLTACGGHRIAPQDPIVQNPYGATFESKKLSEIEVPGSGPVAVYSLIAKNVPPRTEFTLLYGTPGIADHRPCGIFKGDQSGRLYTCPNGVERPLEYFLFPVVNAFPGQSFNFWLISEDHTTSLLATIVPYPIEAYAKDGAHVSLIRKRYDASIIECRGDGFQPNERVKFISRSGLEVVTGTGNCTDKGEFYSNFAAGTVGADGGTAEVALVRLDDEQFVLQYEWGQEALKPELQMAPES